MPSPSHGGIPAPRLGPQGSKLQERFPREILNLLVRELLQPQLRWFQLYRLWVQVILTVRPVDCCKVKKVAASTHESSFGCPGAHVKELRL